MHIIDRNNPGIEPRFQTYMLSTVFCWLRFLPLLCSLSLAQDSSCVIDWRENSQLSPSFEEGYWPSTAVQGDTAHFVWTGSNSPWHVPYRRTTDGGRTFEPIIDLAQLDSGWSADGGRLLAAGSTLYLLYLAALNTELDPYLFVRRSFDRGTTWDNARLVLSHRFSRKEISNQGDTLVISGFLLDTATYGQSVITSTNGGDSWILGRDSLYGGEVHIIYANGNLHEVHHYFVSGFSLEIHYMRSSDFGMTWHDQKVLSTLDGYASSTPMITADPQGNIYVGWIEYKNGCYSPPACGVAMRMSSDNGTTWSDEQVLTDVPWGFHARISASRTRVFAVWGNGDNPMNIEGRVIATSTLDPCPLENLTPRFEPGLEGAVYPTVAIGSNLVAAAWEQEDINGSALEFHIWGRVGRLPFSEMRVDYPPGWNLVSIPVASTKPYGLQNLVAYEGGYVHKDTMKLGLGYWAKGDTSMMYEGSYVGAETVDVHERWNIIGSITEPIPTTAIETIPPGIIQSPFFEFTGLTYAVATTLNPGRAYWVKVSEEGRLIMKENGILK
jgi:hypothetical protein